MKLFRKLTRRLFSREALTQPRDVSWVYQEPPKSYAKDFSDVPAPVGRLSPLLLIARWQTRDIFPEDWTGIAADMLEAGSDTPALRRLVAEPQFARREDAEPFVARLFLELGIPYPISDIRAKAITTIQIAREVIAGKRNAWAAANHLEIVVWEREWSAADELGPVVQIFYAHEQLGYEPEYRPPMEGLVSTLIKSFAELAMMEI